jgi:hypothetical protein
MGISEGGYTTLLNLLNTEPDGAVIAAGYSINFDIYLPSQFVLSNRFGNAPQVYSRDSVKAKISNLQTNTLFTWGEGDVVDLMDPEHDNHFTENFLNNYNQCSYFYNFNTHTFPPCNTLDTFIQRIISKPKAFLNPIDSVCTSDSVQVQIKICGQPPFQFDLYKDDVLFTSFNTNSDTTLFTLVNNGNYQVKNITDASNNPCWNSNTYNFVKDAAINFTITNRQFNCDSNYTAIELQLAGTAPLYLTSLLDGNMMTDTLLTGNITKIYNNGELNLLQLTDSNHCAVQINQLISIKDSLLNVALSAPLYDCDSNKTKISITLEGRSPWVLDYKKNGVALSKTITDVSTNLYFDNGLYEFLQVTDSNLCQKSISQIYNFNFDSLVVTHTVPVYSCDSGKTQMQFNFQGNPPFSIHYKKNGTPLIFSTTNSSETLYFENGNYVFFHVSDSTGCIHNITQSYSFFSTGINYSMSTPLFNCDSNKTMIHFDLQGNAPWTFNFTKDGNPQQIISQTDSIDLFFTNGIYQFFQLEDATCAINVNQGFVFNYDSIGIQVSTPVYNCDSNKTQIQINLEGNPPFSIQYIKDGNPLTITSNNGTTTQYFENGNYDFLHVTDATGCVQNINQQYTFAYDTVDYTLSVPLYNCDSNKTMIHIDLQGNAPWNINYTKDGNPLLITSLTDSVNLFLTNGTYLFSQMSDNNCSININQGFVFNYDSIGIQIGTPAFNCDSNKTQIQFDLQGNPPFSIQYTKDGNPLAINTSNNTITRYFENGNYDFLSVTDTTGCVQNINQQFSFAFDTINYTISAPQYNCDSNKTMVHFDLQGNTPWIINYTKDGNPQQITSQTNSIDIFFSNGLYQFTQLSDATCTININQGFVFNYDSIDMQINTPFYNCDSNKTQIQFNLEGNPPFSIQYTKDGNPLAINTSNSTITRYFENGNYDFMSVTDATGCLQIINQQFSFAFDTINYTISAPQYNCDSNKTMVHFDLQGNAPWNINYTKDGNPLQTVSLSNSLDLYLDNGVYQFIQLSDATCSININQGFVFNYSSIGIQVSVPFYNCDSNKTGIQIDLQGNPPFNIQYTKNGIPLTINTNNSTITQYFENGNYDFLNVTDVTGCMQNINQQYTFAYDTIDFFVSAPLYNCDSNKTMIHFDLQGNAPWNLAYTKDGIPQQVVTNNSSIDLYLTNGNYQFTQLTDATNCAINMNQIFSFNFNPLSANIAQQNYDCDSNKFRIDLALQGNSPFTIEYNNGFVYNSYIVAAPTASLFLPNGNWVISKIKDATNCEFNLNFSVSVNYDPLSVAVTTPIYDCDSNKVRIDFALSGNAPWKIHFTEQNLLIADSVLTYNSNYSLYLNNGLYLITQVTDSTNCANNVMQSVNNFYTPLTFQQSPMQYNCDSTKMYIQYTFTGDAPYSLSYVNNVSGIITQLNSAIPSIAFYLGDGDYTVLSVQDLKCTASINDTIHINYPKLQSTLLPAVVSCDSNKLFVQFATPQGNPPYTYYYYFNNQYTNFTSYSTLVTLYLNNGQYFFDKVVDSMGCAVIYNQALNANYTRFQYNGFSKKYMCEKDSTELTFNASVFMPTYIAYTVNGGQTDSFVLAPNANHTFTLPDGNYELLYISDSIGCTQILNQQITIAEEPVDAAYSVSLNCALRKYTYQFALQGKAPWTLSYHYLNMPKTEMIYDSSFTWNLEAGKYYFSHITDSNGCIYNIQKTDTLKAFLNDFPTLYYRDFALHTINTPHQYYWYQNENLIDTVSKGTISSHGNGIYKVLIVDDLGCENWSNELTLGYPADINVFPNPATSVTNIVVNDDFGDYWQYQLYDMSGKLLIENTLEIPSAQIDMTHYTSGVYSLIIRYENQTSNQKNVIRLVRE